MSLLNDLEVIVNDLTALLSQANNDQINYEGLKTALLNTSRFIEDAVKTSERRAYGLHSDPCQD